MQITFYISGEVSTHVSGILSFYFTLYRLKVTVYFVYVSYCCAYLCIFRYGNFFLLIRFVFGDEGTPTLCQNLNISSRHPLQPALQSGQQIDPSKRDRNIISD